MATGGAGEDKRRAEDGQQAGDGRKGQAEIEAGTNDRLDENGACGGQYVGRRHGGRRQAEGGKEKNGDGRGRRAAGRGTGSRQETRSRQVTGNGQWDGQRTVGRATGRVRQKRTGRNRGRDKRQAGREWGVRRAVRRRAAGREQFAGGPAKGRQRGQQRDSKNGSSGKGSGENLSQRFVGRTTNYAYLCTDNYEPHPSMIFRTGNTAAACQRKRHHRLQGAPSIGIRQNPMDSASHYPG